MRYTPSTLYLRLTGTPHTQGQSPDFKLDEWWIDTGTTHTRTVGDVTLRALPFFRPLCHGPVNPELV